MTETTTIQVRKEQAKQLQELQRPNGNYKTAIDRLLEAYADSDESQDSVSFDDIEKACKQAIRGELPVERMG